MHWKISRCNTILPRLSGVDHAVSDTVMHRLSGTILLLLHKEFMMSIATTMAVVRLWLAGFSLLLI